MKLIRQNFEVSIPHSADLITEQVQLNVLYAVLWSDQLCFEQKWQAIEIVLHKRYTLHDDVVRIDFDESST